MKPRRAMTLVRAEIRLETAQEEEVFLLNLTLNHLLLVLSVLQVGAMAKLKMMLNFSLSKQTRNS